MKVKITWIYIPSDLLPHDEKDDDKDMEVVADGILEEFEKGGEKEELTIDEKTLIPASILSSRIIEDLPSNLSYFLGRWGGKYFSGDVSGALGEIIVYAVLEEKFGVKFLDILPLREVKFMGMLTDTFIHIGKYEKLKKFVGDKEGKALLFVNIRSSVNFDKGTTRKNLMKDLTTSENLRYPDNYSLLSYVFGDGNVMMVVIKP
ncbi:hypothetical protein [Acidianus sp. HS-5]|uniref:hypothetical protein n=1 Tax=Acidianus sp. HS-5 TaxID=2886040 RepID=UPI001F452AF2|nr:hypothetical protein [Acidianus sp. HS-5]BDC18292.1 hypothetical protein HS5_11820 [Acidianus sp. HS-5]